MRLRWFENLHLSRQLFVLAGALLILIILYISLSNYLQPLTVSLLALPLEFYQKVSFNAKQFLIYEDLTKENRRLKANIGQLTAELVQLQEAALENTRLRKLLSLSQRESFSTVVSLVIGQDSSSWTKLVMINKGSLNGIRSGMPVISGAGLVGKVIAVSPAVSKVILITDFNSKIPALIQSNREEGIVFGTLSAGKNICKMKYIRQATIGDQVITSGLGKTYPKGLLIGKVVALEEEKDQLYTIAEVAPEVDFSTLEEVMIVTGFEN